MPRSPGFLTQTANNPIMNSGKPVAQQPFFNYEQVSSGLPVSPTFNDAPMYSAPDPLMSLADSPLYQSYLQHLQDQQQQAYDINLEALNQNLATSGYLGGSAIEAITDLTNRSFQAASPHEIVMPYLMNLSGGGMSAAQGLGGMNQGFGGMMNTALGNYGMGMGNAFGGLSGSISDAFGAMGNQAIMGGNLGAQSSMLPFNALMGGMNLASGLGGLGLGGGSGGSGGFTGDIGMGGNFGGIV